MDGSEHNKTASSITGRLDEEDLYESKLRTGDILDEKSDDVRVPRIKFSGVESLEDEKDTSEDDEVSKSGQMLSQDHSHHNLPLLDKTNGNTPPSNSSYEDSTAELGVACVQSLNPGFGRNTKGASVKARVSFGDYDDQNDWEEEDPISPNPNLSKPGTIPGMTRIKYGRHQDYQKEEKGAKPTIVPILAGSHNRHRLVGPAARKRITIVPPFPDKKAKGPMRRGSVYPHPQYRPQKGPSKSLPTSIDPPHRSPPKASLTICIRRRQNYISPRTISLSIPNTLTVHNIQRDSFRSINSKEPYSSDREYDDEVFFRQLRLNYSNLAGLWRFFSARSLKRINLGQLPVVDEAKQQCYCPTHIAALSHQSQRPHLLSPTTLSGLFSEENLMQHYANPGIGRSRYNWVKWVYGIVVSNTTPTPEPITDDENDDEESESNPLVLEERQSTTAVTTLEFIEDWALNRVITAILTVIGMSILACSLWLLLSSVLLHNDIQSVELRVETGLVMGIWVLLLGGLGIVGWIGISWIVD